MGGMHHQQRGHFPEISPQHWGCHPSTSPPLVGSRSQNASHSTPTYHPICRTRQQQGRPKMNVEDISWRHPCLGPTSTLRSGKPLLQIGLPEVGSSERAPRLSSPTVNRDWVCEMLLGGLDSLCVHHPHPSSWVGWAFTAISATGEEKGNKESRWRSWCERVPTTL